MCFNWQALEWIRRLADLDKTLVLCGQHHSLLCSTLLFECVQANPIPTNGDDHVQWDVQIDMKEQSEREKNKRCTLQ